VSSRVGSDANVRAGAGLFRCALRLICRPDPGARPDAYRSGGVTY